MSVCSKDVVNINLEPINESTTKYANQFNTVNFLGGTFRLAFDTPQDAFNYSILIVYTPMVINKAC